MKKSLLALATGSFALGFAEFVMMGILPATATGLRVSVPAARSGIATAIVLGIGRAIGEAMAILMVAGNVANMPSLLSSVKFLTTAIASEMSYAAVGSLQRKDRKSVV